MKTLRQLSVILFMVLGTISVASADPMPVTYDAFFRDGNLCPTDGDMTSDNDLSVQYHKVDAAIECMYVTNVSNGAGNFDNPVGTTEEANIFLNTQDAIDAGWAGTAFVGITNRRASRTGPWMAGRTARS